MALALVESSEPGVVRNRTAEPSGGVLIITPRGLLDGARVRRLRTRLRHTSAPRVVIDLSDCILAHPGELGALDPGDWLRPVGRVAVACPRPSARQLLTRAGIPSEIAVCPCTEDAIRAVVERDAVDGRPAP